LNHGWENEGRREKEEVGRRKRKGEGRRKGRRRKKKVLENYLTVYRF